MKKIIKNMIISFSICFVILNILGLIYGKITTYIVFLEQVEPIIEGNISKEMLENDKYIYERYEKTYGVKELVATLSYDQGYINAMNYVEELEIAILTVSFFIGVSIAIICSLSESSKIKQILIFFSIGIGIAFAYSLYLVLFKNIEIISLGFWGQVLDTIKNYGKYYIIIYTLVYVIKYIISKNKVQELNNKLKQIREKGK